MSKANIAWLLGYVVWISVLLVMLVQARQYTLDNLTGEEARAEWQKFKQAAREQSGPDGPVQRKVPKSDEPPQLILMRDYFGTCIAGTLLFGSALFVVLMIAIRGAARTGSIDRQQND